MSCVPDVLTLSRVVDAGGTCVGCRACELVCSTFKNGDCNPNLARITVEGNPIQGVRFKALTCYQCVNPACRNACPVDAIVPDTKQATHAWIVDEELCTGCLACVAACEERFGSPRIYFNSERNVAFKCDLCQGAPQCVENCPTGTLTHSNGKKDVAQQSGGAI